MGAHMCTCVVHLSNRVYRSIGSIHSLLLPLGPWGALGIIRLGTSAFLYLLRHHTLLAQDQPRALNYTNLGCVVATLFQKLISILIHKKSMTFSYI